MSRTARTAALAAVAQAEAGPEQYHVVEQLLSGLSVGGSEVEERILTHVWPRFKCTPSYEVVMNAAWTLATLTRPSVASHLYAQRPPPPPPPPHPPPPP
eukprot:CAMPEP_0198440930 /NCGR_PEP_ID=MMETSP1452-20131203/60794_1 /TAXON_ID=1181717 /ORGANISM="Synchroma pusillum, Strain CCMP3072" /LENGTH=98 /DNA_ID=CAMNT_0044161553 /DNA_START=8 /DNA_END=301 /DNA_ORIENTATION=+